MPKPTSNHPSQDDKTGKTPRSCSCFIPKMLRFVTKGKNPHLSLSLASRMCLGKAKNTPQPPPKLLSHRLAGILCAQRRLLVLTCAPEQKVEALSRSTPSHALDNLGLGIRLHSLILNQGLRNLIRHTLQLCICETGKLVRRRSKHLLGADLLGGLDGSEVVRCKDNVHAREGSTGSRGGDFVGPLLADDSVGTGVVVGVCSCFGVEGDVFGLRSEVCAADKLDTRNVAFL